MKGVFFNKSKKLSFAIFRYCLKGGSEFFLNEGRGVPEKHECYQVRVQNFFASKTFSPLTPPYSDLNNYWSLKSLFFFFCITGPLPVNPFFFAFRKVKPTS